MFRPILFAALGALALAGCGGSAPTGDSPQDTSTTPSPTTAPHADEPAPTTAPEAVPSSTPPVSIAPTIEPIEPIPPRPAPLASLSPQAQKGSAGAQAILSTWAWALETHQFGVAWQQFGSPPASRAAYTKWWERYRSIKVTLGQGEGDAGMGSIYYTAPATLTGMTMEGKPFRLQGDVVVRRVNDVDGATPAQLRWHIGTADLKDAEAR